MKQSMARLLAKALSARTGKVYVAKTETAHKGQWPVADEVWIVVNFDDPRDIFTDVPDDMSLGEVFSHIAIGEDAEAAPL